MNLFFVRHKETKLYFPSPRGRAGRGGSFTTANDPGDRARIFHSARAAKIFLSTWCQGEHHCHRSGHDEWYDEVIKIKPIYSRNYNDYEIIEKYIDL